MILIYVNGLLIKIIYRQTLLMNVLLLWGRGTNCLEICLAEFMMLGYFLLADGRVITVI